MVVGVLLFYSNLVLYYYTNQYLGALSLVLGNEFAQSMTIYISAQINAFYSQIPANTFLNPVGALKFHSLIVENTFLIQSSRVGEKQVFDYIDIG